VDRDAARHRDVVGEHASGREPRVSGAATAGAPVPPRETSALHRDAVRVLGDAVRAASAASGPEDALAALTNVLPPLLGDRAAHLRPGGLKPGERQFSVSGVFLLTPDARESLLVAETGFPPEQHRLRIPADLAHPGWVVKHRRSLLLRNTDRDAEFKQILKTARMGSAMYAPMLWRGELVGQLVLASQARETYAEADLEILVAFAEAATALWIAHDGPAWLRTLGS
jgi:hypothetical protein